MLAVVVGCHREEAAPSPAPAKPRAPQAPAPPPKPLTDGEKLSRQIEAFTGSHTKLVWNECVHRKHGDPMSVSDTQVLMGLDSADGQGGRVLLAEEANYSRPLITSDGQTILFSRKDITEQGKNNLFQVTIYRTDWKGAKPVALGEGYAVDTWRDPATGKEWVYVASHPKPSVEKTFDVEKLVRFPLEDPKKVEVVWDKTSLSPDNIQLSRDGHRVCALLPWPDGGVLHLGEGAAPTAQKFTTGCWPSESPDNSHVFWVFNGDHQSATFFAADQNKSWVVALNGAPQFNHHQVYHPRWTNHPRFMVLSGPYTAVNGGGAMGAQIHLGRFSPKRDRIEEFLQITHRDLAQGFPAAWIEGGDKVAINDLPDQTQLVIPAKIGPAAWPSQTNGLVFLWTDRPSLNVFTDAQGQSHSCRLVPSGPAKPGRLNEMSLDGGQAKPADDAAAYALQALQAHPALTFEALVIPPHVPASNGAQIFASPVLSIGVQDQALVCTTKAGTWQVKTQLPVKPFHLVLSMAASGVTASINGAALELAPGAKGPALSDTIVFGGSANPWKGGLMHIALYDRALTAEEIAANANATAELIAKFPPAPSRVELIGKLVEISPIPKLEVIAPYTSCLVSYVYDVQKITAGGFSGDKVLVKHWGLLNRASVEGMPRVKGKSYTLVIEQESDHPELKGERVNDETDALRLDAWLDVGPVAVKGATP